MIRTVTFLLLLFALAQSSTAQKNVSIGSISALTEDILRHAPIVIEGRIVANTEVWNADTTYSLDRKSVV